MPLANRAANRTLAALAAGLLATLTLAEPHDEQIEVVEVVAPLSLEGQAQAAHNSQAATAQAIAAARTLDLAQFLERNLASVFINEAQGNPLQPDVQYRGFVGSPLLGLPQGIAVYQDAVRINEPFGDTVNWALVPKSAIEAVFLVPGSNPLFGLNALGGALSIRTKDGFLHPGVRASLAGGSFGRWHANGEVGGARGERLSYFGTVSALQEKGWRDFSPTDALQAFTKLGWRGDRARVDMSVTAAATDLVGNGAAPEELLALRRTAVFTRPDRTRNDLLQLNVVAELEWGPNWLLRGNVYRRASAIRSYNGDDSDFEECAGRFLCRDDADGDAQVALDRNGNPIVAAERSQGAAVNRTHTEQSGTGFTLQAQRDATVGGRSTRFVAGLAFDTADVDFAASTELGTLDDTRLAIPGGVFVGDAFTSLAAQPQHAALYLANVVALREDVQVTVAARYNRAKVVLRDRFGTALNGDHQFHRLNPALGATYQAMPNLALYASYGEANRTPSPVELTCADEDDPCRLPNAFLADPPLRQVVARTLEAGARGKADLVAWRVGWFRTRNADDILFISAGAFTNEGYFDNVGTTLRQGIELSLHGEIGRWRWFMHYTLLNATFEDAFSVASANHPRATDGEIHVRAGDRLPLVPRRLLKAGLAAELTPRVGIDAELLHVSGQHFRGDEANWVRGLGGYTVVNFRMDYRLSARLTAFASINNLLDRDYATFGVFGEADEVLGDRFESPRFVTPSAPRAAWLGIEIEP